MPRLTRRLIAATEPGPHDIILRDDALPGFHVRIRRGGSKTYFLHYRARDGRERRLKIARCDELVPERAREIARDLVERIRKGADPAAERQAARTTPPPAPPETYAAAVADYIRREQQGRRQNATAGEVQRVLLKSGRAWHERPVASLTAAEIRRLLEDLRDGHTGKARPYLANRMFSHLRAFFAWCAEPGIDKVQGSPMLGLKRPWEGETPRSRVFTDDELRALWRAADELAGAPGALLKVLMLTGKRKNDVAPMRWADLDERGRWQPSAQRRRNKRLHPTTLPRLALRVVLGLPRLADNPHVFVGRRKGSHVDPGSALQGNIQALSGVEDFFYHACRHTVETRLAALRVPPHIRDLVLDHAPHRGAGADYDHHHYEDEMREALEAWAAYMEGLLAGDKVRVLR